MKNVIEIKSEAKEQIIKLLEMCGCYKYKEEHIDEWLDVWEKACSPQIENIAEKSQYYDGKCKIVFPSEYPRGIDVYGIRCFCDWLKEFVTRNLKTTKIHDLTLEESQKLYSFYSYLNGVDFSVADIDFLPENMREGIRMLSSEHGTDDYWSRQYLCEDAYRAFRNSSRVKFHNGQAYDRNEFDNSGAKAAITLASILNENYARTQFLDERLADNLNYYFGKCKFSIGQKLSRAVNSIASKYGISKDPDWNKEFAKYADSINPLMVTKWTVISWHPVDMLTFSFGNSWSTCSNIDKRNVRGVKIGASRSSITNYVDENYRFRGEHSAAALSYMFDKTSFIYYTVNHKYTGNHYEEQDKESRIVFSLNEEMDTLLQSRLYPQCNDDNPDDSAYRIPREIVQKVIADALGVPNLWKVKTGSSICRQVVESNGVHYNDWADERNNKVNISWLTELTDTPKTIKIGSPAICPRCGETHWYTYSLNCEDCDPLCN